MLVTVVPYNPQWPQLFEEEAKSLRALLGENLVALFHIGSTSVPGLAAKPIIDILPVVQDIDALDALTPSLQNWAMRPWGSSVCPAGGISAKAGKTAPIKSTPSSMTTWGRLAATSPSGIICGPTPVPGIPMPP